MLHQVSRLPAIDIGSESIQLEKGTGERAGEEALTLLLFPSSDPPFSIHSLRNSSPLSFLALPHSLARNSYYNLAHLLDSSLTENPHIRYIHLLTLSFAFNPFLNNLPPIVRSLGREISIASCPCFDHLDL